MLHGMVVTGGPILFAYDGSEHAQNAVERAGAVLRPGSAVVVCVWMPIALAASAATLGVSADVASRGAHELDAAARERAERLADEGAELARAAGFKAERRAVEGTASAWHAILHCADELDAAVIVTGSRGRSSMAAALLGSTAQGLLHHAHRPVLVVSR
jgi:nucleotide-binding universal stress UspA family protein